MTAQIGAQSPKKERIIVAVHGIGDQFQFATVQSVAHRYCAARNEPQPLPLGRFYDKAFGTPPKGTFILPLPLKNEDLTFAEVYWADIPRIPEKAGYTIEESTKWAKTVIDRLRQTQAASNVNPADKLSPTDFKMAESVLEQMIETITVLEQLTLVADKAGVFKFDLKKILVSYLGDVQLVTDFANYRAKILHRFFEVMTYIAASKPDAEIYIVAHSEGTVITLLSLLEAISGNIPQDPDNGCDPLITCNWLKQLRGLMTIGSPIDKHLVFWPDLWLKFQHKNTRKLPHGKIAWKNYYDYGDPIGFELDHIREWLCKYDYDEVFEFPKSNDHGFSRYPLPGKAHNDYWTDDEVFDHFIKTVIDVQPARVPPRMMCPNTQQTTPAPKHPNGIKPPGSIFWKRMLSVCSPFVLFLALIFCAVYLLSKAVNEYEGTSSNAYLIFKNVSGIASLVIGLTVMSQIPRLTRRWKWRFGAIVVFLLSCFAFAKLPSAETHERLGYFANLFVQNPTENMEVWSVLIVAAATAAVVYVAGRFNPKIGLRVLIVAATAAVLLTVGFRVLKSRGEQTNPSSNTITVQSLLTLTAGQQQLAGISPEKRIWPLILAAVAFMYLWWLAALVFDLVIVWHYYIRRSIAMQHLRKLKPV